MSRDLSTRDELAGSVTVEVEREDGTRIVGEIGGGVVERTPASRGHPREVEVWCEGTRQAFRGREV
jgi:hypothetical protein